MRRFAFLCAAIAGAAVSTIAAGLSVPLAPAEASGLRFDFQLGWDEPPPPRRFRRPLRPMPPPDGDAYDETELYADLPPAGRRFRHGARHRQGPMAAIVPHWRVPLPHDDWRDEADEDDLDDSEAEVMEADPYGGALDDPAPRAVIRRPWPPAAEPPVVIRRLPAAQAPKAVAPKIVALPRPVVRKALPPAKVPLSSPKVVAVPGAAPLPPVKKPAKVAVLRPYVEPPLPPAPVQKPAPAVVAKPAPLPAPSEVPRTAGKRTCPKGTEIEKRLMADGWSGFADPEKKTNSVLMTAKRDGNTYRLTLDRCTGVVLSAKLLASKQAAN